MRRLLSDPMTLLLLAIMAFQTIRGGRYNSPQEWLMSTLIMLPGIVIGLSLHEFAHAWVANRLGDPTPKQQGRVTINPLAHVDPIGLIALIFIGFGWGKPVQINPAWFKKRRRDEFLVSIAGVVTNFILALLFMGVLRALYAFGDTFLASAVGDIVNQILIQTVLINIVLMVFNLLPIPPLDGFNVVVELFNLRHTEFYRRVYDKGFVILMVLILLNVTGRILSPAVQTIFSVLVKLFFGY